MYCSVNNKARITSLRGNGINTGFHTGLFLGGGGGGGREERGGIKKKTVVETY